MAKLSEYRAQIGLQVPVQPRAQKRDFVGAALEQFGGAVSAFGGAMLERQERRDAFEHDVQYREWRNSMNEQAFQHSQNINEGGSGHAKNFMDSVFDPSLAWLDEVGNPDMQARLRAKVADDRSRMFLKVAGDERNELTRFQTFHLEQAINDTNNDILSNPENYDSALANIMATIEGSNLPAPAQGVLRHAAEQAAIGSYLESQKDDPASLFMRLGGDLDDMPIRVQETLYASVLMEEGIVGNTKMDHARPDGSGVVERAGKHGLTVDMLNNMAVTLGDPGPVDKTADGWNIYLSNPVYAAGYVQQRVSDVLATNPGSTEEFFARFYHGDDASAEKLSALPSGVQTMVRKLARSVDAPMTVPSNIRMMSYGPSGSDGTELPASSYDGLDPEFVNTVKSVMAQFGASEVRVRQAERPGDATYGAGHSEHKLKFGGAGAMDLDVRHLSHEQRVQLIEMFSAAGIKGIGVYKTSIHVDMGSLHGRRAWGQGADGKFTFANIPNWAKDALGRHVRNEITTAAYPALEPRLQNVDARVRTRYMEGALTDLQASVRATLPELRVEAGRALDDYIVALDQGNTIMSDETVRDHLTVLTPSAAAGYEEKIAVANGARRVFEFMDKASDAEIGRELSDMSPDKSKKPLSAIQMQVYERAVDIAQEIRTERRHDPVAAALSGDPKLGTLWEAATMPNPLDPSAEGSMIDPKGMEEFIDKALEYQKRFNLQPQEVRTLPRIMLVAMADKIDNVTRATDPKINKETLLRRLIKRAHLDYRKHSFDVLLDAIEMIAGSDGKGMPEGQVSPENALIHMIRQLKNERDVTNRPDTNELKANTGADGNVVLSPSGITELVERMRTVTEGMSASEKSHEVNKMNVSQEDKVAILKGLLE